MINIDGYCKSIRKSSEEDLKKTILVHLKTLADKQRFEDGDDTVKDNFDFVEGSFDLFMNLIKKDFIFVQCICDAPLWEGREFLVKMLNCFKINNVNIDKTLVSIIIDSAYHPKRISGWTVSEIAVISDTQEKVKLQCYSAECMDSNNWKQGNSPYTYSIICHDKQLLWHTPGAYSNNMPEYFVMKNKRIYGLSFSRTYSRGHQDRVLCIYYHLGSINNNVYVPIETFEKSGKDSTLDEILMAEHKRTKTFNETRSIDLTDRFRKGFFYKGLLFNKDWDGPFYDMKIIGFLGKFLKIEITNLTYPHAGFILLDLENKKIVMAQKYSREIETEEEALASMDPSDDFALSHIPEKLRTAKVCLEAVKENPEALLFTPEDQMTEELCLEAVKHNGWALQYVPPELKTLEVCLEAVKEGGTALKDVPDEFKTPEFCLEAIKQDAAALIYVPEEIKTASPKEFSVLFHEAVKRDAWILIRVPEEFKTVELCLEAAKHEVKKLQYVPEHLRDEVRRRLNGEREGGKNE